MPSTGGRTCHGDACDHSATVNRHQVSRRYPPPAAPDIMQKHRRSASLCHSLYVVFMSNSICLQTSLDSIGGDRLQEASSLVVWVIWAESPSRDTSPSLLLGYALLTSRAEGALFLRMATGFGFAQVWRPHASLGSICRASHPQPLIFAFAALVVTQIPKVSASTMAGAQRHATTQAIGTLHSECAASHYLCCDIHAIMAWLTLRCLCAAGRLLGQHAIPPGQAWASLQVLGVRGQKEGALRGHPPCRPALVLPPPSGRAHFCAGAQLPRARQLLWGHHPHQ